MILETMLYNANHATIEENMSQSNVGARKHMGARNHIFVVNSIIHDVVCDNTRPPIDDYKQCFDSMNLPETLNAIYDSGVKSDHFKLLYDINKVSKIAIKTTNGLTERRIVNEIVQQGGVWGPKFCSNQFDTFGKECEMEEKHQYKYKGILNIPGVLGFVDDTLGISECGPKSAELNAYLNVKTDEKKLQFNSKKCLKMHIGKKNEMICPDLTVNGWRVTEVNNIETGDLRVNDEYIGEVIIPEKEKEKYLGDILSNDGRNTNNIKAKQARGIGSINQIMSILKNAAKRDPLALVANKVRNPIYFEPFL